MRARAVLPKHRVVGSTTGRVRLLLRSNLGLKQGLTEGAITLCFQRNPRDIQHKLSYIKNTIVYVCICVISTPNAREIYNIMSIYTSRRRHVSRLLLSRAQGF